MGVNLLERNMKNDSLAKLFSPGSLAVIGASRREGSLGKMFLDAVTGMNFTGRIYPVNPKADKINNIKCYHDINSLPEVPDVAVILVGKDLVLPTVDMLAEKKVKNIVVISAGFRETGSDGQKRESALVEKVHSHGMRMIGPNSMGFFNTNPAVALNATFSPTLPVPGHVAFISQSGALGVAVLELSRQPGLGFSVFVSTGNKADVDDVDALQFAARDENTKVISLYMESVDRPQDFRREVAAIVPHKPVLVLKAGTTESGSRAASSHTGALASSDLITDAFLRQCGVIRCQTLQELLYSSLAFSLLPLPHGNRVAVVTNAGGPGILATDALENSGLTMPVFSELSLKKLRSILPEEAAINNPVDMIASATHETYRDVCTVVEQDTQTDAILVIIVKPPVNTTPRQILTELNPLIKRSGKPFLFVVMADQDDNFGSEAFAAAGVPVFPFPELAARALGNLARYKKIRDLDTEALPVKPARKTSLSGEPKHQVPFEQIAWLLGKYDIPMADFLITDNREEGFSFLKKYQKIAVKIANEDVIHKSDLGLVYLNITTPAELTAAFSDITEKVSKNPSQKIRVKYLLQQMIPGGLELILGSSIDPLFGPLLMFGIGGVNVEIYRDIVFKLLPLGKSDAGSMIDELKSNRIFDGFRGMPAINKSALAALIRNMARLITEHPQITEMDMNPLIWPSGYDHPVVVDCRMTVSEPIK